MSKKELYVAPEIEVLEVLLEGVIATSDPNDPNFNGLGGESNF